MEGKKKQQTMIENFDDDEEIETNMQKIKNNEDENDREQVGININSLDKSNNNTTVDNKKESGLQIYDNDEAYLLDGENSGGVEYNDIIDNYNENESMKLNEEEQHQEYLRLNQNVNKDNEIYNYNLNQGNVNDEHEHEDEVDEENQQYVEGEINENDYNDYNNYNEYLKMNNLNNLNEINEEIQNMNMNENEIQPENDNNLNENEGMEEMNYMNMENIEMENNEEYDYNNQQGVGENNENEINENEEENKSQMISLMKLQYISICQSCKEKFNPTVNIPFMLKCGHFFCRNCLLTIFTDDEGRIFCPEDAGVYAKSIEELKVLNNLIYSGVIDNQQDPETQEEEKLRQAASFCVKHPNQRITHIIEETKETMCVHCAFQTFKKNPHLEIKEISELCTDILEDVNTILENNQHYVEILQATLKGIKENKSKEEEKVITLYDALIKSLEQKKEEYIDSINSIFSFNADKLSEKLDVFSSKMEEAEEFKVAVNQLINNPEYGFQVVDVINHYQSFIKEGEDYSKNNLEMIEYKFNHENESKIAKYLQGIVELKQKQKIVKFKPKNFPENETIPSQILQSSGNNNKNYEKENSKNDLSTRINQLQGKIENNNHANNNKNYIQNNSSNPNSNQLNKLPASSTGKYTIGGINPGNTGVSSGTNKHQANLNTKKREEFDPSSSLKNNYEILKANNFGNPPNNNLNTNNNSTSHYAAITKKTQGKADTEAGNKYIKDLRYSQEVLNTDELLKEHKETKNRSKLIQNQPIANSNIKNKDDYNDYNYGYNSTTSKNAMNKPMGGFSGNPYYSINREITPQSGGAYENYGMSLLNQNPSQTQQSSSHQNQSPYYSGMNTVNTMGNLGIGGNYYTNSRDVNSAYYPTSLNKKK